MRGVRGWGRVGEKITLYPDASGEAMHVLLLHAGSAFTICRDLLYLIACFVAIWACCHYKYLWGHWKVRLSENRIPYHVFAAVAHIEYIHGDTLAHCAVSF